MKRILVFLIFSLGVSASVHPPLSLKGTGIAQISFEDRDITQLTFAKEGGKYRVFLADSTGKETELDAYESDREVLSVFYEDTSGNGIKEIFILTRGNGEYKVEVYSETYKLGWDMYEMGKAYALSDYLTCMFKDKKDVDAGMIRKAVKKLYPADYESFEFWTYDTEGKIYEGLDLFSGRVVGYYDFEGNNVDSLEKAQNYIVSYGNNIYGKFMKWENFALNEIFEGKAVDGKIVYNGRYEFASDGVYRIGTYVDGVEEGEWQDYLSGSLLKIYYKNGVVIRSEPAD